MFKYIFDILKSKNPNLVILKVAILLAFAVICLYLYRISTPPDERGKKEGFTQKEEFVLKQNQGVYDDFYAEVYDGIHDTNNRSQKELMQIVNMTEPDTKHSVFLDVGSGTGQLVNELKNAGYEAYGIDKSQDMNTYAENKHPEVDIKCGDVIDPMSFEKSTFTHVLCTDKTIYSFEDKLTFFRNCFFWLMPNGYLVLHLVEPDKFEMIQPKGNANSNFPQKGSQKVRKIDTMVEFYDFKYAASYRFPNHVNKTNYQIQYNETFTDKATNHVRQNEQTLHMNSINDILDMASRSGFIFHGKADMKSINGDANQYFYVFERPM